MFQWHSMLHSECCAGDAAWVRLPSMLSACLWFAQILVLVTTKDVDGLGIILVVRPNAAVLCDLLCTTA